MLSHTHTPQSLRLCLQYETEALRGFTNESQLDLGCFKATAENKEAAHSGFAIVWLPLTQKGQEPPGKALSL